MKRWLKNLLMRDCKHKWVERTDGAFLYRKCSTCPRLEKFEPDCGGNTAGHWDEVK